MSLWREFRSSKRVVVTLLPSHAKRRADGEVHNDPKQSQPCCLTTDDPLQAPQTGSLDDKGRDTLNSEMDAIQVAAPPRRTEGLTSPQGSEIIVEVRCPPPIDSDFLTKGWCSCVRCQCFLGTVPSATLRCLIGYQTHHSPPRDLSPGHDSPQTGGSRLPSTRKRPSGVIRCGELLTLRCPLSWRPVAIPVRFADCTHSGVFDLVPFVHQQLNRLDHYQFGDFLSHLAAPLAHAEKTPEEEDGDAGLGSSQGPVRDVLWRCPCCGDAQRPLRWVTASAGASSVLKRPLLAVDAEILALVNAAQPHSDAVAPKALVVWRSGADDGSWQVRR